MRVRRASTGGGDSELTVPPVVLDPVTPSLDRARMRVRNKKVKDTFGWHIVIAGAPLHGAWPAPTRMLDPHSAIGSALEFRCVVCEHLKQSDGDGTN